MHFGDVCQTICVMNATSEKVTILPDVIVQEHIIDEETATLGAVNVLELIDAGAAITLRNGIWLLRPGAIENELDSTPAFNSCRAALLRFAGVDCPDSDIFIMNLWENAVLAMHQDYINGSRSLLTLAGFKEVRFAIPELENAHTQITQGPGDAYTMDFTNGSSSRGHEVEYFLGDNIVIYINH